MISNGVVCPIDDAEINSTTAFVYFVLFALLPLNVYFFCILIRWTLPMVKQTEKRTVQTTRILIVKRDIHKLFLIPLMYLQLITRYGCNISVFFIYFKLSLFSTFSEKRLMFESEAIAHNSADKTNLPIQWPKKVTANEKLHHDRSNRCFIFITESFIAFSAVGRLLYANYHPYCNGYVKITCQFQRLFYNRVRFRKWKKNLYLQHILFWAIQGINLGV